MGRPTRDLTKEGPFGRLTVLARTWNGSRCPMWVCECECGEAAIVSQDKLVSGHTKSCGCLRREVTAQSNRDMKATHGMSKTGYYAVWRTMIARCENPKHVSYKDYGGRGISVCMQWRHSFEVFSAYMGERPDAHEIDRIDSNGDYEPGNCRWVTPAQNTRNRRVTPMYEHEGETASLGEWAERFGIPYRTLKDRIRHGWSIGRAINEPVKGQA